MIDQGVHRARFRRVMLACLVSVAVCVVTAALCVTVLGISFSDALGIAGIALAIVGIPLNIYAAISPTEPPPIGLADQVGAPGQPVAQGRQLIVGDVPAEAAALQPRTALLDQFYVAMNRKGWGGEDDSAMMRLIEDLSDYVAE